MTPIIIPMPMNAGNMSPEDVKMFFFVFGTYLGVLILWFSARIAYFGFKGESYTDELMMSEEVFVMLLWPIGVPIWILWKASNLLGEFIRKIKEKK